MNLTATHPNARRYPTTVHTFARRLFENGRTVPEVRLALARVGHSPSEATVRLWVEPDAWEADRLRKRVAPSMRKRRRQTTWEAKWRRMRRLRDVGLSFRAIGAVMELDYGVKLTHHQIRHAFRGKDNGAPRRLLERAA